MTDEEIIDNLRRHLAEALWAMKYFGSYAKSARDNNTDEYMNAPDGYWARFKIFEEVYDRLSASLPTSPASSGATEEVCVCGHKKSDHRWRVDWCYETECKCGEYRPAPPVAPSAIPSASVSPSPWLSPEGKEFYDSEKVLAVVELSDGGCEYHVVTAIVGEDDFRLTSCDESWGWEWDSVAYWMPVPPIPSADAPSASPSPVAPLPSGVAVERAMADELNAADVYNADPITSSASVAPLIDTSVMCRCGHPRGAHQGGPAHPADPRPTECFSTGCQCVAFVAAPAVDALPVVSAREEVVMESGKTNPMLNYNDSVRAGEKSQRVDAVVEAAKQFCLSDETWEIHKIDQKRDDDTLWSWSVRAYRKLREAFKALDALAQPTPAPEQTKAAPAKDIPAAQEQPVTAQHPQLAGYRWELYMWREVGEKLPVLRLVSPAGENAATVFLSLDVDRFNWHTWGSDSVGGENGGEPTVRAAMYEAEAAVIRWEAAQAASPEVPPVPEDGAAGDEHLPVGTTVIVTKDDGAEFHTTTRSKPWQLRHGAWVVRVVGISGGYDLTRIRRAPASETPQIGNVQASGVHYVIRHPHTQTLLTISPGRFESEGELRQTVGTEFFDERGVTILLDDCDIKSVPTKPPSDLAMNESTGHRGKCLCVSCKQRRKDEASGGTAGEEVDRG